MDKNSPEISGEVNTENFKSGSKSTIANNVKKGRNKKIIFVSALIIIISILLFVIYYYLSLGKTADENTEISYVCKEDIALIEEFRKATINDSNKDIQVVADKVRAKQGFESDPNCLFIITENDINRAIYDDAKSNFDKLKAANTASPDILISDIYRGRAVDFTVLEARVEYLKKLKEQAIENGMINQFKRPE